jgi:hypothetical protein
MKKLSASLICLFILSSLVTNAQKTHVRATKGDTVWVIVNHVKPDKKDQFEKFLTETFWGASKNLKGNDQAVFKQTRILYPTKPESDGTLSYIFLMDPLIANGDYDIQSLLKKMYGDDKAGEYSKVFDETSAAEQTMYVQVQSEN